MPRPNDVRDPATGLLNPREIAAVTLDLAASVGAALDGGRFPIVLGGDCSILLGPMLALRRRGRYGLVFIDGHADFQHPSDEPAGEVASLDDHVLDEHVRDTAITVIDYPEIRDGAASASARALAAVTRPGIEGFWVHLDVDVLDDGQMPAVDYRHPGGLTWEETAEILRGLLGTGSARGLEVTIFNPLLDADGSLAQRLSGLITKAVPGPVSAGRQ